MGNLFICSLERCHEKLDTIHVKSGSPAGHRENREGTAGLAFSDGKKIHLPQSQIVTNQQVIQLICLIHTKAYKYVTNRARVPVSSCFHYRPYDKLTSFTRQLSYLLINSLHKTATGLLFFFFLFFQLFFQNRIGP